MKKSGFYFIEGMPRNNLTPPGTAEPSNWSPYKLWAGDLWQCEGCGAEIVSGFGQFPIAEHYQSNFADEVKKRGASYQVNDC